jgi:glucans biosynthesis protein
MTFAYSMRWTHADLIGHTGGRVAATRTAEGKTANLRKFVVDFEGGELDSLSADEPVMGIVNVAEPGTLVETQISKNRITGGWRLVFLVNTDKIASGQAKTPVELRAFLKRGEDVLTETWNYTYLH